MESHKVNSSLIAGIKKSRESLVEKDKNRAKEHLEKLREAGQKRTDTHAIRQVRRLD
jgi:predicted transcriptional regulator